MYHLTTLDVFESIVVNGLLSRGELLRRNINFVDTANPDILLGRERLGLENCIPFHFHIYTAYDTEVKRSHNKSFIYLCLSREYAENHGFKILPLHPTALEQPQLFEYSEGFKRIDWEVMEMTKEDVNKQGIDERYHKQVRMAECLSPKPIAICDFQSIAVKDEETKQRVNEILDRHDIIIKPYIDIKERDF